MVRLVKISTRGRYGTRALLELALNQTGRPVPLKDIAERQQIPLSYLEHLVASLVAGGLLKSTRGVKGGVSLARSPEKIKLSEVIELLEGSSGLVNCVNDPLLCARAGYCITRDVWEECQKAMDGVLASTTLRDLVERQKRKEPSGRSI